MHIEVAPRRPHRIGLTPLIDVVFILLVFFMLASSLLDWRGIELSTGSGAAAEPSVPPIKVTVLTDGSIRYQGETYPDPAQAAARIKTRIDNGEASAVVVEPDSGVTLGPTIAAFDALAGAGIDALSLGQGR